MSDLLKELNAITPDSQNQGLPQLDKVVYCLEALWFLLFPDHRRSNKYFLADVKKSQQEEILDSCQKELVIQIQKALAYKNHPEMSAQKHVEFFLSKLPDLKKKLLADAKASCARDPAASGIDEIIITYPSFLALMTYRLAHELALEKISLIPRMMTEYAHSLTGCDIHPEAKIGEGFFIDHATGVVIGQTSVIGNHVTLFQGVTLGALAIKTSSQQQRHPTVEDDVVIYANATILGGKTIIGKGSVIGGSCWITSSVPPYSKIMIAKPQMIVTKNEQKIKYIPSWDI